MSLPALLAVALALPPTALAGPSSTWAWVVGRKPTTASYTPAAKDQGNSSGGTNTIKRLSPGDYTVTLPGVVNSFEGGDVQVSALGAARFCTVKTWNTVSTAIVVEIHCHTLAGTLADSAFSLMFLTRGETTGTIAYVWANLKSTTTSYTPDSNYQSPGNVTIQRTGSGEYTVRLPGLDPGHLDVQVTGYDDAVCIVLWTSNDSTAVLVHVECPGGDSRFDLLYLDGVGPTGVNRTKEAYAFVAPTQSTPADRLPGQFRYSSVNNAATLTKSGIGQYVVTFPGMPKGGMALVTAAKGGAICYLSSIRTTATPQRVGVKCAHSNGTAVDADFFLAYTK